jgi:hypothetical protein
LQVKDEKTREFNRGKMCRAAATNRLVEIYKNFSSFSVYKNKKILKNTGKVESNLL